MELSINFFFEPKSGNEFAEYEDAFWVRRVDGDGTLRLAVADGATETSFARPWAELLVRGYGKGNLDSKDFCGASSAQEESTGDAVQVGGLTTLLRRLLKTVLWRASSPREIDASKRTVPGEPFALARYRRCWRRYVGSKSLPWYAEEKLALGAFSTLLGLTIYGLDSGRRRSRIWSSIAVGDSCLFQLRHGKLIDRFPIVASTEFGSRPELLGSSEPERIVQTGRCVERSGAWRHGDSFLLMTDALACWFLTMIEAGHPVIETLQGLRDRQSFLELVTHRRRNVDSTSDVMLKNDDVTMIVCRIGAER